MNLSPLREVTPLLYHRSTPNCLGGFRCLAIAHPGRRSQNKFKHGLVEAPPKDFNYRAEILAESNTLIEENYPALISLASTGTLVALQRSPQYKERRTDGYKEPELIFLVGAVHGSKSTIDAVKQVVQVVRPDNVVLELCRGRTGVLYDTRDTQAKSSGDSREGIRLQSLRKATESVLNGSASAVSLLLLILADRISSRIQEQVGVQAGAEMKAAKEAAEEVGSQLVLGDRPIEITLERTWNSLNWRDKLRMVKLVFGGLTANVPELDEKDLVNIESDDAVEVMLNQLSESFPQVASPLLHERDLYLSWSLKRSKAVNGSKTVVGIIGRGHIPGVIYHLKQDSSKLRFRDLAGTRQSQRKGKSLLPAWLSSLALNVGLFYVLTACWERWIQH